MVSGLIQKLRGFLGAGDNRPWYWWAVGGGDASSAAGVDVTCERAMRCATVFGCVRVIAEGMGCLPLTLNRRLPGGGKERATDAPLWEVLHDAPNAWQTSQEFVEMLTAHACLRGNGYARIIPGPRGAVDTLIPLHPARVKVERIAGYRVRYLYTNDRGGVEPYLQDEILHLRFMSLDGITGLSPIAYARESVGLAIATEAHGAGFFGRGARPGYLFKSDRFAKPEAAQRFVDEWDRRHAGSENSHRTAVVPTGLDPVSVGIANNDSQFLETRKFQRAEICGIFRVPPHMIGDLERATFSNIEQQSIDFVVNTLLPWCRRWEGSAQRDLVVDKATYFVKFVLEGRLRGDAKSRAEFYEIMQRIGVFSVNDVLELEDMNAIGPLGDKRIVPMNMTTLERVGEAPPATPASAAQRSAGLALMDDAIGKLFRWEVDAVKRLAGKPAEFGAKVDEFYAEHSERMLAALALPGKMLAALGIEEDFSPLVAAYVGRRVAQCKAAAESRADVPLKDRIETMAAGWSAPAFQSKGITP